MRPREVVAELGLMVLSALLAWLVVRVPVLPVDVDLERAVQAVQPPWLDSLTAAVSWVGFPPQSTIIDALIVIVIFASGQRWQAVCAAFAAGGSAGLWFLVAPLVHRPRPTADLVRVMAEIPFGSFPSGHVMNITAFFGFLAVLCLWGAGRPTLRRLGLALCCLLIVAIGFARIYSGEHWPSDVLAGYALGAAWLLLSVWLYRAGAARWGRQTSAHQVARP